MLIVEDVSDSLNKIYTSDRLTRLQAWSFIKFWHLKAYFMNRNL